ncbi:MAG: 50S ribosomal protein L32 [Deltaproteobacteria bacterium]|nr:50S ribosomal protein L32 [Deltaproteobacteria bacterium]
MAVPKKRTSRRRRDMRRSHHAIQFTGAVELCPNCGELKLRHRVCDHCGQYRGRQVVKVEE